MSEGQPFDCGEQMTIERIESIYSQLESTLVEHTHSVLVADRVQQCDTASLQLIASFFKAAKIQGHCVQWLNPSSVVINVAELLGLVESLELTQHVTQ